ncbi:hypothetical protein [Atlantibacter subterraneus]|uniref:hypothetical protein n=1 Tax=Atlantibacter subterraneus TaxID=255519 RepID=UPI002FDD304E
MYVVNKHPRKTIVHHLADLDKFLDLPDTDLSIFVSALSDLYPEISQDLSSVLSDYQRGAAEEARSGLTFLRKSVSAPSCKKSHLNRDLPDDLRQQIISTVQAGNTSLAQICKQFGITATTLRHLRHEAGLPIKRRHDQTSFTDTDLRKAMRCTTNQKELAQQFGVQPQAINHRIRFLQ